MDYGELKNDTDFINKSKNLDICLNKVDLDIQAACDFPNYENLSTEDKVKFDLFLLYSINSLYWMLCKLQAVDAGSVNTQKIHTIHNIISIFDIINWIILLTTIPGPD